MAKSDNKKQRSPEITVVTEGNVASATYFDRDGYKIVAKVEGGQFILARCGEGWGEDPQKGECIVVTPNDTIRLKASLRVKHNDTLLKVLGKKFALKEPHNSFVKILTSLDRRGIPYVKK